MNSFKYISEKRESRGIPWWHLSSNFTFIQVSAQWKEGKREKEISTNESVLMQTVSIFLEVFPFCAVISRRSLLYYSLDFSLRSSSSRIFSRWQSPYRIYLTSANRRRHGHHLWMIFTSITNWRTGWSDSRGHYYSYMNPTVGLSVFFELHFFVGQFLLDTLITRLTIAVRVLR